MVSLIYLFVHYHADNQWHFTGLVENYDISITILLEKSQFATKTMIYHSFHF